MWHSISWEPARGFGTYLPEDVLAGQRVSQRAPWCLRKDSPKWRQLPRTSQPKILLGQCPRTSRESGCRCGLHSEFLWQTPWLPLHLLWYQPPSVFQDKYRSQDIPPQGRWLGTCLAELCKSCTPNQGPRHWHGRTSSRSEHAEMVEKDRARRHLCHSESKSTRQGSSGWCMTILALGIPTSQPNSSWKTWSWRSRGSSLIIEARPRCHCCHCPKSRPRKVPQRPQNKSMLLGPSVVANSNFKCCVAVAHSKHFCHRFMIFIATIHWYFIMFFPIELPSCCSFMLCVLYLMTSTCGSKSKDEQRTHKSGMEHKGRILPSKFTVTGVSQYRKCREKKTEDWFDPWSRSGTGETHSF